MKSHELASAETHSGNKPMTDQDRVEALLDLPCDEQFRLATRLAANVGYVLTPEPLMDAAADRASPDTAEIANLLQQYRQAWRDAIDQMDSEASHRENWDGSDHNLQAFDRVMEAALSPDNTAEMRAFGASDAACYKWPEDTPEHKALRAAYIEGAADCGGNTAAVAAERERCELIVYRMKTKLPWSFHKMVDEAAAAIRKEGESR